MPVYNYVCDYCQQTSTRNMTFEEFDKAKNKKSRCEKCGKTIRRILLTSPKITFKGKGFYLNDSKNTSS